MLLVTLWGKKKNPKEKDEVLNGITHGLQPLCDRINFLKGVTQEQIKAKLDENNYLRDGVKELFYYLNKHGFITVLSSGNIYPILKYYQELLNITFIFGSMPNMNGNAIANITEANFKGTNFKYEVCLETISKYEDKIVYGIGDSSVNIQMLSLADISFAIEPKGSIDKHTTYVIRDMREIIDYLEKEVNKTHNQKQKH